ncbi:flagellar biosynthesis protein FlgI [Candidatus Thiodiazotropha endoloripes]|uniref:flagellar basal body P-ring protein FlgI n=1 Tax=Candidatus Thiodiazotropha endoloripes TaxID=1818881 RepID=UPI00083CEAAF|nr:flagellar basal body P-ring protein FlgI [Candidatus Thiodiazotropha endoloripes]ODB85643.1 flagellar biosynthesis protein FlgI [Candidatus Thiodiazotropha endoloripes]
MNSIKGLIFILLVCVHPLAFAETGVRIKDLCRISSAVDNNLVGYGLVSGLAGSGDSMRSGTTVQSLRNALLRFGINVNTNDVRSRNVAAVSLTAILPPYAQSGDKIDVNVTSMGDAHSLVGGTLLLASLTGPDGKIYALAQGPVSVGGFQYDLFGNLVQKNHPTAGIIPSGATVEKGIDTLMVNEDGQLHYSLYDPDLTTVSRIVNSINLTFGSGTAKAINAGRIEVNLPIEHKSNPVAFLTAVEGLKVDPDRKAKIVVNERTGTVVSGGNVTVAPVSITHGDLTVIITTDYLVSQPSFVSRTGSGVSTQIVPDTNIDVSEEEPISISLNANTSVAELVAALNKVKATSRDVITILQAIRRAGALHAELIIQ